MVCLHGVPSSAFLYRKVLPELAAGGLRGVAFDFPGLGLAERPKEFESRILKALAALDFPAQALWGDADPALRLDPYSEHVRQARGVNAVTRLAGKHFVREDAPEEIADHVSPRQDRRRCLRPLRPPQAS